MAFQGKIVIVAGAPCSGKGTQSKSLSKKNGMIHISAGDLARCL
jgi:adenylate kinase family enzyme